MINRLNTIIQLAFNISEDAKELKHTLLEADSGRGIIRQGFPEACMRQIAIKADILKANAQ